MSWITNPSYFKSKNSSTSQWDLNAGVLQIKYNTDPLLCQLINTELFTDHIPAK
jgi:hypothetical protein